ncbi:MAG: FIMAH domain-containing protein, partial [Acidimicrobiia bacterium]
NLVGRALIEPSQRDSLSAKLDAAVAKANQKNFKGAIRDLQAFVSQLDAVAKPADREPLVAAAREIIAQFSVVN